MSIAANLRTRLKTAGLSMPKDPNEQSGSIPGTLDTSAGKLGVPDAARSNANTDGAGLRDHSNGADAGKDVKAPDSVGPATQQGTLGDLPHKQAVAKTIQSMGQATRLLTEKKAAAAAAASAENGGTKNAGAGTAPAGAPAAGKNDTPPAPGEGGSKTAGKAPAVAGNLPPQELAMKIACAMMSTEEGQALALEHLGRFEGQAMADGIIKSARSLQDNFNTNLEQEIAFNVKVASVVSTEQQQIDAIMESLRLNSPADFAAVIKQATALTGFAASTDNLQAIEAFKRGMAEGAQMAQEMAPPEEGGAGQSPEQLVAQLQQLAAEMPPEEFVALLQQMVQSGEVPQEVADQLMAELGNMQQEQAAPPEEAMKSAGCDPEWLKTMGVNLTIEKAA